jgi:glycosyltransferase involved in cell wall biosynthesis
MSNLPRLLFLTSSAFNRVSGGGITFGNLFRGWPKDRIATVHNDSIPSDDDICGRYYVLTPSEIRKWGPLERFMPAAPSGSYALGGTAERGPARALLKLGKRIIFGGLLPDVAHLSPKLDAWVKSFNPEVLYTILGSNAMMELALALHYRFGIPVVFHIMDDWLATAYRGGILAPLSRRRMGRLFEELVRVAPYRLGICDAMCRAYSQRYGAPFIAFQNAVDVSRWAANARTDSRPSPARELVYAGSILSFAQLDSLIDCCKAVNRLSGTGEPVRLSIYSPAHDLARYGAKIPVSPNVAVHETIRDDAALFACLQNADALLLPVNFDAHTIRFIRYSMPTKVPAYLASGTPILAYGPGDVAQVQYAQESGWAYVVASRDGQALDNGIRKVLRDTALRSRLTRAALAAASRNHDITNVRARFQALLASAVGSTSQ